MCVCVWARRVCVCVVFVCVECVCVGGGAGVHAMCVWFLCV